MADKYQQLEQIIDAGADAIDRGRYEQAQIRFQMAIASALVDIAKSLSDINQSLSYMAESPGSATNANEPDRAPSLKISVNGKPY